MKQLNVALLMLAVFATSLAQIYVRHQHRIEYVALNEKVSERDELSIEWNQLLTESSTWSFPHVVEKDATKKLSMRAPKAEDMVSIEALGDKRDSVQLDDSSKISQLNGLNNQRGVQ